MCNETDYFDKEVGGLSIYRWLLVFAAYLIVLLLAPLVLFGWLILWTVDRLRLLLAAKTIAARLERNQSDC